MLYGEVSELELRCRVVCCRVLVYLGFEDFGIVFVEVMVVGWLVIGCCCSGLCDSVVDVEVGRIGVLFEQLTVVEIIVVV